MQNQIIQKNENSVPNILYRVFVGLLFGFANVIPGVSGGTVMVVLGVYERIIGIITDFFKKIKTEWKFFLPIVVGMGIAIVIFGKIMSGLLTKHEAVTQMFFVGVIIFSVPQIFKKAALPFKGKKKTNLACLIAFVLMLALMVFMAYSPANREKAEIKGEKTEVQAAEAVMEEEDAVPAEAENTEDDAYEPDHSAFHLVMLVIYGAIACATMIIPGISGSLVMVMLGQYKAVMAAIDHMDIIYLLPFGIGCILGLVFCAKAIRWLLKNHERVTYSAILGFVLGSILPVFPGWNAAFSVAGILAFLLGGACIVGCDLLSRKTAA